MKKCVYLAALLLGFSLSWGADISWALEVIKLEEPVLNKGKTVMESLQSRRSEREYGEKALSDIQLSEVIWAAGGVNRRDGDKIIGYTYPNSYNDQAMSVYAFTKDGIYLYDPAEHSLKPYIKGDHRAESGVQSYIASAPLNLLYVVDLSRMTGETEDERLQVASMNAGHMSANVYLYAASEGLNAICRSHIDRDELRVLLKLPAHFEPLLAQTVGFPK